MSVDRLTPSHLADRYQLGDLIAVGGMGEVYLATDERLARRVAVKVLSRGLTDSPESVERFRREALAAAGLSHPNIARVYDYGVDGTHHFIVMEYLPGHSLDRLIRERGRLSATQAVDIASQVCAALAAAHRAGIVHRDIKPGNVLVSPEGTVKVTDFGISKALGSATLTDAGTILGTAAYLPPEVGLGRPAGPASDLYSLGIVLYQMVTGQVPFSGDTAVTVAMKHISDDVPPPSALDPGLPRFLDRVIARATALRPEDRYADADAMAAALRAGDTPLLESTQAMPSIGSPVPTQAMGATQAMGRTLPATRALAPTAPATQAMTPALAATQAMGQTVPSTTTAAMPAPATLPSRREHHPDDRQRTRPRRPGPVLGTLAALVVIALVAVGATLLLNRGTSPSTATPPATTPSSTAAPTTTSSSSPSAPSGIVPDGLVGSDLASAEQAITSAGLRYSWRMVASDAPRNQVLEASPAAGQTLKSGGTVSLVISRGPGTTASNSQSGNNDPGSANSGNNGKGHGKGKGGN